MRGIEPLLTTLTVMVHGDMQFAEELMHDPVRAFATLGAKIDDPEGIVPVVYTGGPEQIQIVRNITMYGRDDGREEIERAVNEARGVAQRSAPARARPRGGAQRRRYKVMVVGDNPIEGCFEDLIGPPGSPGSEQWTMCPARAVDDRLTAVPSAGVAAQLLPGVEVFEGERLTTLRHGARLIRVAGDATRSVIEAVRKREQLEEDLATRTATARLASRGLVVAEYGEATPTVHRWAVAGVSPRRAREVIEASDIALIEAGAHAATVTEAAREALALYGLTAGERPDGAGHLFIAASRLDIREMTGLARAIRDQARAWSLLWAGPAGWVYAHGSGREGPCPACVANAVHEGAMRPFALAGADAVTPRPRAESARVFGRAIARGLCGADPRGALTFVPREIDGAPRVEGVRQRPQCAGCGRPGTERPIAGKAGLRAEALEEESTAPENSRERCERRLLERAQEGDNGLWTGAWTALDEKRFEADPHGHVLYDVRKFHGLIPGRTAATGR